ncbi:MAG: hypothetical protein JWR18_3311 [Segetibacter sp.]|nr:hypothetical protein [Segetibacter sp.]
MKQLCTISLLLIIFLQTFSRFAIEADYFLNKSYIARVLCINKEKPKMHCNGKCYLAKQLKEQDKQDRQVPVNKKSNIDLQWLDLSEPIKIAGYNQDSFRNCKHKHPSQLSSYPRSIFRPPIA